MHAHGVAAPGASPFVPVGAPRPTRGSKRFSFTAELISWTSQCLDVAAGLLPLRPSLGHALRALDIFT